MTSNKMDSNTLTWSVISIFNELLNTITVSREILGETGEIGQLRRGGVTSKPGWNVKRNIL